MKKLVFFVVLVFTLCACESTPHIIMMDKWSYGNSIVEAFWIELDGDTTIETYTWDTLSLEGTYIIEDLEGNVLLRENY